MKTQLDSTKEQQNTATPKVQQEASTGGTATITDNRPATIYQRKLQASMNNSPRNQATAQLRETINTSVANTANPIQRKENNTGLPDQLKSGIENLSGYAMDDVKVHYNSNKPAQLQAHAYAQGTNIHLAPGQEKHLPHEAWHVVQQKQGRVKPTIQLKGKTNINDDVGLEKEADAMGRRAQLGHTHQNVALSESGVAGQTVQMERYDDLVDQYDQNQGDRVLVLEVNLSGSANKHIAPKDTTRNNTWIDNETDKKTIAYSTKNPEDNLHYLRKQVEFEGPGAERTTGAKSKLRGLMDGGSNGTANLKRFVPQKVESLVNNAPNEQWKKVVVIITAHSRGAVAAYHIAHQIKSDHPEWHVELAQFDPVPGPGQSQENTEGELREREVYYTQGNRGPTLDEHAVIYSVASGWYQLFTPMVLHDMKKLIITQEGHSAGVGKIFSFNGEDYVRSDLNALPYGVYVESNVASLRDKIALRKADSANEAKEWYKEIFNMSKNKSDKGRKAIIEQAIDNIFEWLETNADQFEGQGDFEFEGTEGLISVRNIMHIDTI